MTTFHLECILDNALAGLPTRLDWDEGETMYPKVIWQGIINVDGYERAMAMRCVQTNADDAVIETAAECDAMGVPAWVETEAFYNGMVGDIVRQVVNCVEPVTITSAVGTAWPRIALIKLVRKGAQQAGGTLGLKEAMELVDHWLVGGGRL